MSNFSASHQVTSYDAKKSQALTGQRLAKCRYKTTAKTPAAYPSVCASVPFLSETDITDVNTIQKLVPAIRELLENAQDGILKSLYESADGVLTQVTDSDISIDSCIAYLAAESSGSRLTKEFIESWFDQSVKDYLVVIIGEKLKYTNEPLTEEQTETINRHVAGYRGLYSGLAGGKTMYAATQINSLLKVLDLIDSDSTQEKLVSRLNGMLNKPKIEELLEL